MKEAWKSKLKSCRQYGGNMKKGKNMVERSFYFEKEEKMCLGKRRNGLSMEMAFVITKWQELPPAEKKRGAFIKGGRHSARSNNRTHNTKKPIQQPSETPNTIHNLKTQTYLQVCTPSWIFSPPNSSPTVHCHIYLSLVLCASVQELFK